MLSVFANSITKEQTEESVLGRWIFNPSPPSESESVNAEHLYSAEIWGKICSAKKLSTDLRINGLFVGN